MTNKVKNNEVKKLTEVDILKRDSTETMWTNIIGVSVTLGVIILSILLLKYNPFKAYIETKDLGGYLSGVFAPIAWIWFILSYRLQLIELRMQRKELAESVKAQQDSAIELARQAEISDKQSKALEKQLEIATKQWESFVENLKGRKPLFELKADKSILYKHGYKGNLANGINVQTPAVTSFTDFIYYFEKQMDIINIAGNCTIKKVVFRTTEMPNDFKCFTQIYIDDKLDNFYQIKILFLPLKDHKDDYKTQNYLENIVLNGTLDIFYSFADTSSFDTYIFEENPNDGSLKLQKA